MVAKMAEDVTKQAQEALSHSPHVALRRLAVERQQDRLYISGRVSTFYQKQQAQETVRAAATELELVNDVEVG